MARTKLVDGVRIPLTAKEETERDTDETAFAALQAERTKTQYRRDRAAAYIADLGEEGDFETSVGDVLDALIKGFYGDRAEIDGMKAKIDAIKRQFPKA